MLCITVFKEVYTFVIIDLNQTMDILSD